MDKSLSERVLTIGNRSDKPDGGIAQVLYSYRRDVYPVFNHVVNFKRGNVFYKSWVTLVGYVRAIFVLCFNREIAIVHIHTASGNGFKRNIPFVNLAYFMKKKVVLHIHSGRFNDYYIQNRKQVENVFSKCSSIVALSNGLKEYYEEMGCNNVTVVNNIIEYPIIDESRLPTDVLHYLYLGVITKTKGIYDLLDVIADHKEEFRGQMVLHVGGNKEVSTLQHFISENQIEDIVKFEGWVNGQKKIDLLNLCDVFVLPSYTEGVPISILEAQSYGLFTIATNVGGIPEIVNETTGSLFEPGNQKELYRIIKECNDKKDFIDKRSSIRNCVKKYLPEEVSMQLEKLYNKLLS